MAGKKKLKHNKKAKALKTRKMREEEVTMIRTKLSSLGIHEEFEGFDQLESYLEQFIEHGESFTEKVSISGLEHDIHMVLSKQPHITSSVTLRKRCA